MSSDRKKTDNSLARVISQEERESVDEFRKLLQAETDLSCPLDDVYLLRALRSKKMDIGRAFLVVTNWWKDRHRLAVAHDGLYPSKFKDIYPKQFSTTFANRDKLGRQIILWRPGNWDPKETPFLEIFRSNFPIVDTIANRQETQLNGTVVIVDLTGLSMRHVQACGPSSMRILWNLVDGFPLPIKGIHFINHPGIFYILYACCKTFMKAKMIKRVKFHGYNYESLHEFIEPEILPVFYGGLLSNEEFQEENFLQTVYDREEYFKELFNVHGYKNYGK